MSITDPWAATETEPAAPEAPVDHGNAVSVPSALGVKPASVSADSEPAITTTYKGGTGFDSPWVVTRASSVKEASALLDTEFAEYLTKVKKVAQFFNGGTSAPAQGSSTPQRSNAPLGATEAPSWAPPKPYDDAVYKSKISAKTGKVWYAWMPPTQDDPREPLFFYPK